MFLMKFATGNGLDLFTCVGVTMDGAETITGLHLVAGQRVRNVAPTATSYPCFIRHEVLEVKATTNHFI
jgi:hypothetical protein